MQIKQFFFSFATFCLLFDSCLTFPAADSTHTGLHQRNHTPNRPYRPTNSLWFSLHSVIAGHKRHFVFILFWTSVRDWAGFSSFSTSAEQCHNVSNIHTVNQSTFPINHLEANFMREKLLMVLKHWSVPELKCTDKVKVFSNLFHNEMIKLCKHLTLTLNKIDTIGNCKSWKSSTRVWKETSYLVVVRLTFKMLSTMWCVCGCRLHTEKVECG